MLDRINLVAIFRLLFAAVIVFTLHAAFAASGSVPHLLPWDKAEHFVAFFVLATLAALALPSLSVVRIGLAVSFLGAIVEVVQGLPGVNRDSDLLDWLTDTIAILCALGPTILDEIRVRLRA